MFSIMAMTLLILYVCACSPVIETHWYTPMMNLASTSNNKILLVFWLLPKRLFPYKTCIRICKEIDFFELYPCSLPAPSEFWKYLLSSALLEYEMSFLQLLSITRFCRFSVCSVLMTLFQFSFMYKFIVCSLLCNWILWGAFGVVVHISWCPTFSVSKSSFLEIGVLLLITWLISQGSFFKFPFCCFFHCSDGRRSKPDCNGAAAELCLQVRTKTIGIQVLYFPLEGWVFYYYYPSFCWVQFIKNFFDMTFSPLICQVLRERERERERERAWRGC